MFNGDWINDHNTLCFKKSTGIPTNIITYGSIPQNADSIVWERVQIMPLKQASI